MFSEQLEHDVQTAIAKRITESGSCKLCDVTLQMGAFLHANKEILDVQIPQYNGKKVFMLQCMGFPTEDTHSTIRGEQIRIMSESKQKLWQLIDADVDVRQTLIKVAWAIEFGSRAKGEIFEPIYDFHEISVEDSMAFLKKSDIVAFNLLCILGFVSHGRIVKYTANLTPLGAEWLADVDSEHVVAAAVAKSCLKTTGPA
jgi:hypothetical protein